MNYTNYQDFKKAVSKELNDFPTFFAFSDKQFEEGKKKLNIKDNSEICKIGGGGFIRKTDVKAFLDMLNSHDKQLEANIKADTTGEGFIYSMFLYELNNHEYSYTYELEDTLEAIGIKYEEIQANENLKAGLLKAKNEILNQ